MDLSTILAIIAIVISVISLGFSAYFGLRDRYKLITSSEFRDFQGMGNPVIHVKVVNVGRRLVILRLFGGIDTAGNWSGTVLGGNGQGLYLKENEVFEDDMTWNDLHVVNPYTDDIETYVVLWVEDTRGHRHVIKDSRKNIPLLLNPKENAK